MRTILFSAIVISMISCSGSVNTGSEVNLDGYETEVIKATNVSRVTKKNVGGAVVEEGYITGGKKNGVWLTYYDGDNVGKVKTIAAYSDGILNGPYLEMSNRGQIEKEVHYANNQYNGKFAIYNYGRITQESFYKNNKLNGAFKQYSGTGKIQKEINYKDGIQDGIMRYYNEDGQVTVQYDYKNGEKVSGGMVDMKTIGEDTEN